MIKIVDETDIDDVVVVASEDTANNNNFLKFLKLHLRNVQPLHYLK